MRIKIEYAGDQVIIFCKNGFLSKGNLNLIGIEECAYTDIDALGLEFEVETKGHISIPMSDSLSVFFLQSHISKNTVFGELGTGEKFQLSGDDKVYICTGSGYYHSIPMNEILKGQKDTSVIVFEVVEITEPFNKALYLRDIRDGKNPHFIYNVDDDEYTCRCGHPAPWGRTGFICGTITAYPCEYVRKSFGDN